MTEHCSKSISERVFKVVSAAAWRAAEQTGSYTGSADDQRDGYIHLSSADQLAGTLAKYFRDQADLLLVAFATGDLGPHLKWEPSRGGILFPHYYGALPTAAALWQRRLALGADGIPLVEQDRL